MRSYYINDTLIEGQYFGNSNSINKLSNATFTVTSLKELDEINIGDTFKVVLDATIIFKGYIKTIGMYKSGQTIFRELVINDFNILADKRIVAEVYTDELAGDIVRDIITKILSDENVTEGNIEDGVVITKAVFNYLKASECLEYLCELTGFMWYIDIDRKLNFHSREEYLAPFKLNEIQHFNFKLTKSLKNYRNVQYVRGGKGETNEFIKAIPTPKPDGKSRNFIIDYGLASKPRIFIDDVEVDAADIGIKEKDENKKFYYKIDSNIISQDTSEAVLTDSSKIEITFTGLRDLLGVTENTFQINERKNVENLTSGIYEKMTAESNINDEGQLIQFSNSLLEKYAEVNDKISFKTNINGFEAGQLLNVDKPEFGILSTFLITDINTRSDGQVLSYDIVAVDGAYLGGWETFFKHLINATNKFTIFENDILIKLNVQKEIRDRTASNTLITTNTLYIGDALICNEFIVDGMIIDEVVLNEA